MVVEADVPHLVEMPDPFEEEVAGTAEVTTETIIEVHTPHTADEFPHADDVQVTPLVKIQVITLVSTNPFIHTGGGVPGGPIDTSFLIGYVDNVAFRLWKGEVCI